MIEYFNSKLITLIDNKNSSKDDILKDMVHLIKENTNYLEDEEDFYNQIIEREKVGSTGIGMGIAIPHARSQALDKIVVAIGLLKTPVNFNSLDGEYVKVVVLVGAPKEQSKEYLGLLSTLARIFRNKKSRESIMDSSTLEELIEAIAELD
ncbi:PTS system, nitrogen regulatory IIA component [Cetobacterium ceti]|uniref:PTS system, nitrogen regulatory IIA component n=1 Tax=Cetobacterium ceti TaxID=180163 RepID=A0A1T4JW83_9FUSO|nr:PTS sugar transporter subunit IIA [Cetobacterium ceti]SJZ34327.1 PTS system, nitrogen regulatory IIA component [Cetobacterium ceti]